jgi:hypothetical protein
MAIVMLGRHGKAHRHVPLVEQENGVSAGRRGPPKMSVETVR